MMNGAAMNCRPDQVLHSLHRDSCGLQSAGYHLQMSNLCDQNFPALHSKAVNSQSDHFVVNDSSQYLQAIPTADSSRLAKEEMCDPRSQVQWVQTRKPIDLPIPQFEIDTNYVFTNDSHSTENHKKLDLDTRIELLIKSNALAGMHPIFSQLDNAPDDSNDPVFSDPELESQQFRSPSPVDQMSFHEDDPNKPLSTPPSPFLSRAKYLFWFNKAIELKEQAKAQEQELIEKATRKLQDNISSVNANNPSSIRNDIKQLNDVKKPLFSCLFDEISKEIKDTIKQQFINDVLESTISSIVECWWETEQAKEDKSDLMVSCKKLSSTFQEQSSKTYNTNIEIRIDEKDDPSIVDEKDLPVKDVQSDGYIIFDGETKDNLRPMSPPKISSPRTEPTSPSQSITSNLNAVRESEESNISYKREDKFSRANTEKNSAIRFYEILTKNINEDLRKYALEKNPKNNRKISHDQLQINENLHADEGVHTKSKYEEESFTSKIVKNAVESDDSTLITEDKRSISKECSTETADVPSTTDLNSNEHLSSHLVKPSLSEQESIQVSTNAQFPNGAVMMSECNDNVQ